MRDQGGRKPRRRPDPWSVEQSAAQRHQQESTGEQVDQQTGDGDAASCRRSIGEQYDCFDYHKRKYQIDDPPTGEQCCHCPTNGALSETTVQLSMVANETQAR